MKGLLLTCLLCLSISWLEAQEMTVKRERVFTGTGLYGYMNGGAEQFLEYGVTKLTARDLEYNGEEYTQLELIHLFLDKVKYILVNGDELFLTQEVSNNEDTLIQEVYDIWSVLSPHMWW